MRHSFSSCAHVGLAISCTLVIGGLAPHADGQCSPSLLSAAATAGDPADKVAISGTRAYVAAGTLGLQVYDVSDPTAPLLLRTVDTPGDARGVAVSGTTAYVADTDEGLQVIDTSDPDPLNWAIIGDLGTSGTAFDVVVSGTTAYVADGASGLQIMPGASMWSRLSTTLSRSTADS